jgi:hypothetical protein
MFLQSRAPFPKVVLRIFLRENTASRLTTPLYINNINMLFTLECQLLIGVRHLQS